VLVSGLLNVRCSDVEYGKLEIIERDALHIMKNILPFLKLE